MRRIALLACLLLLSGCGPQLSHSEDCTLAVGEIIAIPFDPIGREQTVYVKASSPDAPIDVHVYLQEHEEAIERKITLGKPPENLLASAKESQEVSLEATVPANQAVVVRLQAASRETAHVHLEVTN